MMDEYTPTTEEIEDDYLTGVHSINSQFTVETARSWFRKWLAAHDAEVREQTLAGFAAVATLIRALDDALRGYEDPGDIDIELTRNAIADIAQALDLLAAGGESRG